MQVVKTLKLAHVPVFNLETMAGWYTVNDSIIAHNCRCTVAYLPLDDRNRLTSANRARISLRRRQIDAMAGEPDGPPLEDYTTAWGTWATSRAIRDVQALATGGRPPSFDLFMAPGMLRPGSIVPDRFRFANLVDYVTSRWDPPGPRRSLFDSDGRPLLIPERRPSVPRRIRTYAEDRIRVFGVDPDRLVELDNGLIVAADDAIDIEDLAPGRANLSP